MSTASKLRLAVFISGSGSNLQALIDACAAPDYPAQIDVVLSNQHDAYGLERAHKAGIPTHVVHHKDYKNRTEFDHALLDTLKPYNIDLICLAGFMRILTPVFIDQWPDQIINTHPSLLPKHGGEGMYGEHVHKAVIQAGDTKSGCSLHYVIPAVDQGPVILQKEVPVLPDDTVQSLAERVIAQEHVAYVEAVKKIALERAQTSAL